MSIKTGELESSNLYGGYTLINNQLHIYGSIFSCDWLMERGNQEYWIKLPEIDKIDNIYNECSGGLFTIYFDGNDQVNGIIDVTYYNDNDFCLTFMTTKKNNSLDDPTHSWYDVKIYLNF